MPSPTKVTATQHRIDPLLEVVGATQNVPLVHGEPVRHVNLDIAASAPALVTVAERVQESLHWYASVHRGAGFLSQVSTAAYESVRDHASEFVGARAGDTVVFTRNTTDALNLLATAIPRGESVLVLDVEHHANLLPWRRGSVTTLSAAATLDATVAALESELRRHPAALLAVTGMSNVTGEVLPIRALAALAHRHHARIAVDGAQLLPHHGITKALDGIDYLAFSGHKLYAPFGAGVLIGPGDWLDSAPPYLAGGGAVRQVGILDVAWHDGPARHEAGTPNTIGVLALGAAFEALSKLTFDTIGAHERALDQALREGLGAIEGVRIARIWPDSPVPVGIVTFALEGYPAALVAAYLAAEHGIGSRDGRFCAHPLLARLGFPEGAVRVSFGLSTRSDDIERVLGALERLVREGPSWAYDRTENGYSPANDPRHLPAHLGGAPLATVAGSC
jgi:selenocysteine lyase/cysteine desulfurase